MKNTADILVLAGPTASGKSGLALEWAAQKNGVIINADSMQVYDALPVLTARPTKEDLAQAPHRLYGVLPPSTRCSAALWRDMALAEIAKVLADDKTPIVVGGTGLYLEALIRGLSPIPDVPDDVRRKAESDLAALGGEAFRAQLAEHDPVLGKRLKPGDSQRLVRAWSVWLATGKSLSYWQSLALEAPPKDWRFAVTILMPERKHLYANCDSRFELMLQHGALDEVRALLEMNLPADLPVMKALGVPELARHLHGEISLEQATLEAKTSTRQFAKRQCTWLNNRMTQERLGWPVHVYDAALAFE